MKPYFSNFSPSTFVREQILKGGHITASNESPSEMVERVVSALYEVKASLSDSVRAKRFAEYQVSPMSGGATSLR